MAAVSMLSHAYTCVGLLFLVLAVYGENQTPRVNIPQGGLRGKYFTTRNGRTVAGFLGIPYAAPPVGELRFRSPQPAKGWSGTRDATQYGEVCHQVNRLFPHSPNSTYGSEDCLFLNVFTPKAAPDAYLPVMVYIHGGAYIFGYSQEHAGPEYLLDKDIVLVAMNYRLGTLGFLTTEDDILPGNYGFKDQSAALRWVRDNIKYFGGNKDSVTIFGESAGGGSVSLHMYSPLSKGLFHAAIAQSGTAHNPWNLYPSGLNKKYAEKAGKLLGCPTQDSKQLAKCLRKAPCDKVTNVIDRLLVWDLEPLIAFRPNIEAEGKDAFLTADPSKSITSVPYMTGIVSEEGAFRVSRITRNGLDEGLKELNDNFDKIIPLTLMLHERTKSIQPIVKKIRKFYFADKVVNIEVLQQVLNLYTDAQFLHGAVRSLHHHKGPGYFYYFSYKGSTSVSSVFGNKKDDLGVAHVDDLLYLFKLENFFPARPKPTKEDIEMSEKIVELWTNFATYRNPTPKTSSFTFWEPVTTPDLEYLHISNEGFAMNKSLLKDRVDFWESLQLRRDLPDIEPLDESTFKDEL